MPPGNKPERARCARRSARRRAAGTGSPLRSLRSFAPGSLSSIGRHGIARSRWMFAREDSMPLRSKLFTITQPVRPSFSDPPRIPGLRVVLSVPATGIQNGGPRRLPDRRRGARYPAIASGRAIRNSGDYAAGTAGHGGASGRVSRPSAFRTGRSTKLRSTGTKLTVLAGGR